MSQSVPTSVPTVSATSEVPAGSTVRHFDELSEVAQEYLIDVTSDGSVPGPLPTDLDSGDVVVYTDYFLVD